MLNTKTKLNKTVAKKEAKDIHYATQSKKSEKRMFLGSEISESQLSER